MPKFLKQLPQLFNKCPRAGMVLIVRDEARFLDIHLRYHRWLGIERAYCYEHRCADASGVIAARFPWVQRIILEGQCPVREAYISELHRHCMNDALLRARREGLDWLLIIDADEFVVTGRKPRKMGLPKALRTLPRSVIEARLRTREVVPCAEYGEVNWHQNPFFALPEDTPHPLGNGSEWSGHLGHNQGQRVVRTRAVVQAYDSHRWTTAQSEASEGMPRYRPLRSREIGWHAHYYAASPEHWLEKFTRHNDFPAHWPSPENDKGKPVELPLEQPIAVWRQCVSELGNDPDAALVHAKSQLFRSTKALTQLAQGSGKPLIEIDDSLPSALRALDMEDISPDTDSSPPAIHLPIPSLAPPPTLKPD